MAQAPDAAWRTLTTKSFRVHYPAEFEAWTLNAAARLESIRQQVEAEVGYTAPQRIDVLVIDPEADSNGSAWPFLRWPRIVLYTNPPPPESGVGSFRDWPELLLTHEQTHLAHLLRPSRNPFRQALEGTLLPIGPLTGASPRWLYEGYATLVEGRLTGSGRPHSDLRAAILRRWAQVGKLPSYGALNSGDDTWMGGSMAYLAGSAYLEWLEARAGRDSLRSLWKRMSARTDRTFDSAFQGVFGDTPRDLYDRFRAELTHEALEVERNLESTQRDGDLFQELGWGTGEPAVSPDGTQLAIVLRARKRPSRLVVWSTGPDDQEKGAWERTVAENLRRDPQDVAPVLTRPLPRKSVFELTTRNGATPYSPRWMPDGKSILFVRFESDGRGFLHPDLFRWTPSSRKVDRITRFADVRDADPAPDGTWAAAVRNRHGFSELVRIDILNGTVTSITEPSVSVICDRPRISPDGSRLLYAKHRDGAWRIVIRDLAQGLEQELPVAAPSMVAQPAWASDGQSIFVSVGAGGFVDLWRYTVAPQDIGYACTPSLPLVMAAQDWSAAGGVRLTRVLGAALAPAPSPDCRRLFFLNLEPHGFDVRSLDLTQPALQSVEATGLPGAAPPATAAASNELGPASDSRERSAPADVASKAGAASPASAVGSNVSAAASDSSDRSALAEVNSQSHLAPSASAVARNGPVPASASDDGSALAEGASRTGDPSSASAVAVNESAPASDSADGAAPDGVPSKSSPAALDPSELRRTSEAATRDLLRSGIALQSPPLPFALEPVQPGKPYGLGKQELFPLLGGIAGPSAYSIELGVRLGDLVGRLNTLFIGAVAPGGQGPRGAALDAAYRGWPVSAKLQLFSAKQTPSEQPQQVPGLGDSLDLTQSGALLDFGWARRTRTLRLSFDAGGLIGAVDPESEDSVGHRLAFARADLRRGTTRGVWRLREALEAQVQLGETGEDGWTRYGGRLELGLGRGRTSLDVSWRRDWSDDASSDFDRLSLGGLPSSILPPDFASARIENPALPAGTLIGDRYESQRVGLKLGPLPLPIFYERHRAWDDGSDSDDWLELLGAELHLKLDAFPLVRAPGLELVLGVAGVFGDPLDGKTNFWFGTSFHP